MGLMGYEEQSFLCGTAPIFEQTGMRNTNIPVNTSSPPFYSSSFISSPNIIASSQGWSGAVLGVRCRFIYSQNLQKCAVLFANFHAFYPKMMCTFGKNTCTLAWICISDKNGEDLLPSFKSVIIVRRKIKERH